MKMGDTLIRAFPTHGMHFRVGFGFHMCFLQRREREFGNARRNRYAFFFIFFLWVLFVAKKCRLDEVDNMRRRILMLGGKKKEKNWTIGDRADFETVGYH